MIINDRGRQIIMENEGCSLKAYLCPAGRWTIGYGHTGNSVVRSLTITQHQADVILESDLKTAEYAVEKACPKANANQFSAMVSLCFNIGSEDFKTSTLVKRFNESGPLSAAEEFPRWCHAGKNEDGSPRVLPGLVKRRAAERALFLQVPS